MRAELGLTQYALAERLNVRPQVVASWEQGRKEPSAKSYFGLAKLASGADAWFFLSKMGLTAELVRSKLSGEEPPGVELLQVERSRPANGQAHKETQAPQGEDRSAPIPYPEIRIYTTPDWKEGSEDRLRYQVQVPVLRDAAAAGSPREINERDIESFIAVPAKFVPKGPGSYVGMYIRGNSMEPVLRDHFIVVVDCNNRDVARLRGQIVAAQVDDGIVVKTLSPESQPERLILRSENPEYEDIVIEPVDREPLVGGVVFWWGMQGR